MQLPKPQLYKPAPAWPFWAALGGAVLIHSAAVVIAGIHPKEVIPDLAAIPDAVQMEIIQQAPPDPEPTPPPEEEVEPPPPPPPMPETPEFREEQPTPPPKPRPPSPPKPVQPIARPKPVGVPGPAPVSGTTSMSSARANAISLPHPEYPYEARRAHVTGSGVCLMTVDPSTGNVTDATMAVSTGNPILDNATVTAFRRARFKPGTVSKVKTPITFTMNGAQF